MTDAESAPIRVGHLMLGDQMLVVYFHDGRVVIPFYPPTGSDTPLNALGEVEPDALLSMRPRQAAQLSAMLSRAAEAVVEAERQDAREEDGLDMLNAVLAAAAEINQRFDGIKTGELQELSDRLAEAAIAWKTHLDKALSDWNPLRLVADNERDDGDDRS